MVLQTFLGTSVTFCHLEFNLEKILYKTCTELPFSGEKLVITKIVAKNATIGK